MGRRHLYNTTGTHSREEGRSNTHTCQCVSMAQPLFKCTLKKTLDILCHVLCCAYAYVKLCVRVGGSSICVCMRQVCRLL